MINKRFNIQTRLKNLNVDEDKEIAYVSGWASKSVDSDGNPKIDRDFEFVDVKNFKINKARTLLRDHNMNYPIGKMKLSHKPEGLWIDAEVHKAMCEKTYYAVKNGILDSFSIGFSVEDYDFINVKGMEILRFKSGEVYETSIISVASNDDAIFESVKSVVKEGKCLGFECSIKSLKAMNPELKCDCKEEKGKNMEITKEIKEKILKGLTLDETMAEPWNVDDNLWQMFRYFIETIEDNIYEFKYSETYSKEEMLTNINSAMEIFKQTIEEESTLIGSRIGKAKEEGLIKDKGQDINTKSVEETPTIEAKVETNTTPEQTETSSENVEDKDGTPNDTPVQEDKTEVQKEEEVKEEAKQNLETEAEAKVDSDKVEENKEELANTLNFTQETIDLLKIDLNTASNEEVEELFNRVESKLEDSNLSQFFEAYEQLRQNIRNNLKD